MTDMHLIVAECRAADLLVALQAAVNGEANWRLKATRLLNDIRDMKLPAHSVNRLLELDARKRAAEQMEDAAHA